MENIDQVLPVVEIDLAGETHKVTCSFEVLYRFELLTGLNPFDSSVLSAMSPARAVQLVACALYEDPEKHLKEVSKKLGARHAAKIGELITKLLKVSLPSLDDSDGVSEGSEEKKA